MMLGSTFRQVLVTKNSLQCSEFIMLDAGSVILEAVFEVALLSKFIHGRNSILSISISTYLLVDHRNY